MSGDQTSTGAEAVSDSKTADEETEDDIEWSDVNWLIILLFIALTVVGIALSAGVIETVVAIPQTQTGSGSVTIPLFVYLYSGFGALGYIITKLMNQIDQYDEWNEIEHLVAMGIRIPAAMILATGIYLFLGDLGQITGTTGARFAAGVAFLVGLYVNVALKALGSLADRILGRAPRRPE